MGLYNSSGVLLTYNDDGLEGKNSAFSYTPNASGYYYIDATAYYPSDSGAYELTFTSGSSPSFDAAMGAGVIDSDLFWGAAGSPVAITYGFRQSWSSAYSSTSNLGTFSQLTAAEISGVRSALQFWSDICGITFTEVNPGGYTNSATMLIGNYSDGTDGAGAFAYYPNTANTSFASSDGDLWLNRVDFH
jgi:serralysin